MDLQPVLFNDLIGIEHTSVHPLDDGVETFERLRLIFKKVKVLSAEVDKNLQILMASSHQLQTALDIV